MENCLWVENPKACFDEFLNARAYSDKTQVTYKSVFYGFVTFIEKHNETLKTVNERIMQEWLIKCGVSHATEIRYLALLSDVFGELIDKSIVDENYAFLLKNKKTKLKKGKTAKRLPVALDEKEFNLLMSEINKDGTLPRIRITTLLLLACGLRETELCELKAKNVHLDVDQPYLSVIGKGNKEREVPIPDEICRDLELHESELPNLDGCFVGVERDGIVAEYSPSGVFRMIQGAMRRAGIVKRRMSPHVLRHTYATRQLQAGIPLATVSLWMGHDSVATTMVYQHAVIARSAVRPKL